MKQKQEQIIEILVDATSAIFGCKKTQIEGNAALHDIVKLSDGKTILQKEIPKVIVVGIASSLEINDSIIDSCVPGLMLGDNSVQVRRNIERYKILYNRIANHLRTESEQPGVRRFIIAHNMVLRKMQNIKFSKYIPEFPYRYK